MDDIDDKKKKRQKHEKSTDHDSNLRWMDVPKDILGLVLEKLHLADKIRFRAVCKNWCVPKDDLLVKCSDYLPWMVTIQVDGPPSLQLFDPHSQELHKVVPRVCFPTEDAKFLMAHATVYASKHGWLLGAYKGKAFLHNPFKNVIKFLPPLLDFDDCLGATFTASPDESPDCEILVLLEVLSKVWLSTNKTCNVLSMKRYCLSWPTGTNWETQYLQHMPKRAANFSTHYLNGKFYCLMRKLSQHKKCRLMYYNLSDKSWTSHRMKLLPETKYSFGPMWLTDKGGRLIVVQRHRSTLRFMVLSYDCHRMCWAEDTDMDDTAFFICSETIIQSAASSHSGCSVYFLPSSLRVYCNYFVKETKIYFRADDLYQSQEAQIKQASCHICFIEPPYFRSGAPS